MKIVSKMNEYYSFKFAQSQFIYFININNRTSKGKENIIIRLKFFEAKVYFYS